MDNKKIVALASDHAGADLKNELKNYLIEKGFETVDLGPEDSSKPISYATQGHKLANYINNHKEITFGLGFCGTGLGISYALNRHENIRAARVTSVEDAKMSKMHNNANILVMGGRITPIDKAKKMLDEYLNTQYEGGRHQARIEQIDEDINCS
ncbi:Ribose 5-phosphate isomerase B [Mycoplasmopsis meleagridis]|uniref:Ribose 5-phosphate isomerase B n=1 Tax=Mycoplasmopsis meleagridis ATCC 25294 TaxID=1264554 RepID=A0A0F5H0J0_9BACT|nr:RpiB/LacA/LacB family sugar-phosphate isomerase [Mycoplasmopsis meleagridis]KKB26718.1 Ribose 5-phosphate isomerase B [Mycoplasmopsis meleagridis ATCC 25294]KUH47584.1 ribose-5-phosphate isomerase [Mycoplasmopsis meleagridis]OAD18166.1 Ribose 5-phosphate isomerase B [Mycoplasmopsis meleagridis]VEU77251.1 ribose-5-phosphate isomerase B [Mycoplasmopsis meleagridis]